MKRYRGFHTQRYDGSTADAWHSYTCSFCNNRVSGAVVAADIVAGGPTIKWLWCTECGNPSVLALDQAIYPGVLFGPQIEGLPSETDAAYGEARRCMSVNAFTAAELICRKILMHVAVEKGAKEGDTFINYISHLEKEGYVTPPMKKWVTLIKDHGNDATHVLEAPNGDHAESTVMFTAELLRLVYEMEHLAAKYDHPTQ
ncbi:MAG: DUF4145 domain-containing protein [Actinomycetota bacterium]